MQKWGKYLGELFYNEEVDKDLSPADIDKRMRDRLLRYPPMTTLLAKCPMEFLDDPDYGETVARWLGE